VGAQGVILNYNYQTLAWTMLSVDLNPSFGSDWRWNDVLVVSQTVSYAVGAASEAADAEGAILVFDGAKWVRTL